MSKPLKVAFVADEKDLQRAISATTQDLDGLGDEARDASKKVEAAFGSTAEAADQTASASSQLAGGIGDLAGAFEATGLISEGTAQSLAVMEASIMGVTGASDLLNLATEKIPGLQKIATATTKGLAAAKRALGVAIRFAMGPVGLILIGLTALSAGVVYLWKNNETFRRVVIKVWQAVKNAIGSAADWIGDKVTGLIGFFRKLPGRMSSAVSGLWDGIKDGFKGAINWVIDKWNNFSISLPGITVPGIGQIGGFTLNTPNIPRLANGGIITRPTTIHAGEKGREAIVPLDGRHSFGGDRIEVNVNVGVGDPVAIGREVQRVLDAYRGAGGRPLATGMGA